VSNFRGLFVKPAGPYLLKQLTGKCDDFLQMAVASAAQYELSKSDSKESAQDAIVEKGLADSRTAKKKAMSEKARAGLAKKCLEHEARQASLVQGVLLTAPPPRATDKVE